MQKMMKVNGRTEERLRTRGDVAEMLILSKRSVDRLTMEGCLHPIKIGKRALRFHNSEIQQLIKKGIEV